MSDLKALLFDFDETLCPTSSYDQLGYFSTKNYLVQHFPEIDSSSLITDFKRTISETPYPKSASECSHLWRANLWAKVVNKYGIHTCRAQDIYASFIQGKYKAINPNYELLNMLEKLSEKYKMAIITNGRIELQLPKLIASGTIGLFNHISVSGLIGTDKPEGKIFLDTCEKLSCTPEEAIHIGDSFKNDIVGAYSAGLKAAVWLRGPSCLKVSASHNVTYITYNILELPEIIKKIDEGINEN